MFIFWFTIGLLGLGVGGTDVDDLPKQSYKASIVWFVFSGITLFAVVVICAWKDCWKRRSGHEVFENDVTCEFPNVSQREFTIFAPMAAEHSKYTSQSIEFEVLPEIRPRKNSHFSYIKPAGLHSTVARGGLAKDWFEEPYCSFPRDQLHYIRLLGKGWFGQVIVAEAQGIIPGQKKSLVVVKVLQEGASYIDQMCFLHEVKVFKDLFHTNILKLLGSCLQTEPYLLVLEYCCSEDLKSYLLNDSKRSKELLQSGVILRMLCEVGNALHYMHKHGFVHNDLSARNCLVSDKLSIKIGDYGCGIELYQRDYYYAVDAAIPIRWCSPSSLFCTSSTIETKEVTVKDNVWTFGVLLWETLTLGKLPYFDLSDEEVIQKVIIDSSVLLPPVSEVDPALRVTHSDSLYNVMLGCWKPETSRYDLELISQCLDRLGKRWSSEKMSMNFDEKWDNPVLCCTSQLSGTFAPSSLMFESDFCGMNHRSLSSNESELFLGSHMLYQGMSGSLNNLEVSMEDVTLTSPEVSNDKDNAINVIRTFKIGKESDIKLDKPLEFHLGSTESPQIISSLDYPNKLNRDPLSFVSCEESSELATSESNVHPNEHLEDENYASDITRKVEQKSKSVQDLFRLTHMGVSDNSDNESCMEEINKHSLVCSSEGSLHTLDLNSKAKKEESSAQELETHFDNIDKFQVKHITVNPVNVIGTHKVVDEWSGIEDAPLCMPEPTVTSSALSQSTDHIPSSLASFISTDHTCTQKPSAHRGFDMYQSTSLDSDDLNFFSTKFLNDLTLCDFRSTPNSTSVSCQIGLGHNLEVSQTASNPVSDLGELESSMLQEHFQPSSPVIACNSNLMSDGVYHPRVIFGPCDDYGLDYYQSVVSHTCDNENYSSAQAPSNTLPEGNFPEFDSEIPSCETSVNNSWVIIRSDDSLNTVETSRNYDHTSLSNKSEIPNDKDFCNAMPLNDLHSTRVLVCEYEPVDNELPDGPQLETDFCEEAKELLDEHNFKSCDQLNDSECEVLRRETDLLSIRQQLQLILPDFSSQIPSLSDEFDVPNDHALNNSDDQLSALQMSLASKPLESLPVLLSPIVELSEESSLNSSCEDSSNSDSSDTTRFSCSSIEERYENLITEDILHQLPGAGLPFDGVCNSNTNLYFETIDYSVDDYLLVDTETNEAVLFPLVERSQDKSVELNSVPITSDVDSVAIHGPFTDLYTGSQQKSYQVDSCGGEQLENLLISNSNAVACENNTQKSLQCQQQNSCGKVTDQLSLQVSENDRQQYKSAYGEEFWKVDIPESCTECYDSKNLSHFHSTNVDEPPHPSLMHNSDPVSSDDSLSLVQSDYLQSLHSYNPDWQDNSIEKSSGCTTSSQSLSSSEEHIYFVDSNMVGTEENKSSQWDKTLLPIRSSMKNSLEEKVSTLLF